MGKISSNRSWSSAFWFCSTANFTNYTNSFYSFDNNRNIALINRAYCIENPKGHKGYGELVWGLTASDTPGGYRAAQSAGQAN